ncbi:phosphodiesterase [Ideonella dechloratans]|uniref:phosphodiesterase n=1 Tax=Ideonella dechloratans TaxID=36863 RepID=UPI0035B4D4AF
MLIAQLSDCHITRPGTLASGRVDTAALLQQAVASVAALDPAPDLVLLTGDLVDSGHPAEYTRLRALLAPLRLPMRLLPGNHDDRAALREAFPEQPWAAEGPFAQWVLDQPQGGSTLRLIGLDTVIPGRPGGMLCRERLDWLADTLAQAPRRPTLLALHHPPLHTGLQEMDGMNLGEGREALAGLLGRHPQVQALLCGHLHRHIHGQLAGVPVIVAPGTAHQIALELRPGQPARFNLEPPGYLLHRWSLADGLVTLGAVTGDWPGPYAF